MNCMASLVKYILFLFNIIFLVCGVLLIVLGSLMLGNLGDFKSFAEVVNADTIPILCITLGCIIFVISFFGCCGAIRENSCCTTIYAIFMFILLCLQIAFVVWVYVKFDEFITSMENAVDKAWDQNDEAQGFPMDALQVSLKCCGKVSYQDYTAAGKSVPKSCCGSLDISSCPADVYESKPGCRKEFADFWRSNMNIIRYGGIGVAIIELVAFTVACCLASSMRRSRGQNF